MADLPASKPRRSICPEEMVYVELVRTADSLTRILVPVLKVEDLSLVQYNVLRILSGTPEGLPCGEIAERMITRDPDITRLLDRLEKRKLISRRRESKDRRQVVTRITPEGSKILSRLRDRVQQAHLEQLGHLGQDRLQTLTALLLAVRTPEL